jgi:glycosyltransferase involved in cell wall biosynthesis
VVVFHLLLLGRLAREWQTIDVILFHAMSAVWMLPLRLVRRLTGGRRPLLMMDTRDLPVPDSLRARLRVGFYGLVQRLANRWADGQTAITPQMAQLVHIPSHQLWGTWPSGVNPERFAPARADRRWPSAHGPVHLIYVGVLLHERNLLPLCQAVREANRAGMAFRLWLVGDGAARADLEEYASGAGGQIRVIPPVPHEDIPQWLAKAHVGVTALFSPGETLFQASSPIKLFEYMAAGLPVLAMRMPCHTNVVGDGDYVFWVERPDVPDLLAGLQLIWDHREVLSTMGSAAAVAAQGWTWRAAAEKLKQSLEYGLARCCQMQAH